MHLRENFPLEIFSLRKMDNKVPKNTSEVFVPFSDKLFGNRWQGSHEAAGLT